MDKYESSFILYESAWSQGKCLACQSDWFGYYRDKSDILWDSDIVYRRRSRNEWWKYSR